MMKNLFREAFQFKETQCTIISDKNKASKQPSNQLSITGKNSKNMLEPIPSFFIRLSPFLCPLRPLVAKLMAEAAEKANVGPMAAVAGVLADLAVKDMIRDGCEVAVVENGGEVSAVSNRPIDVALSAGDAPLSKRFGFRLDGFSRGHCHEFRSFQPRFEFRRR